MTTFAPARSEAASVAAPPFRTGGPKRSVRLAALRVPLAVKLVGANCVSIAVVVAVWIVLPSAEPWSRALAVAVGGVVHLVLILIALRPIRELEAVASRVWEGDYGVRVEQSAVADQEVVRVGAMFNTLLDGLVSDHARMRALAAEVIQAGDRERAGLARELHDSTAQRLAALLLQVSTAARDCTDSGLAARLSAARDAAMEITEEVRLLSHTVHPRLLEDLGLVPALQKLARDSQRGSGIDMDVDVSAAPHRVPNAVGSVLYRIAQEAMGNALRHGSPHRIRVVLQADEYLATLAIHDDGSGFDLAEVQQRRAGIGLLSMSERLTLVDGWLEIKTARGNGTTVLASIPLLAAPDTARGTR